MQNLTEFKAQLRECNSIDYIMLAGVEKCVDKQHNSFTRAKRTYYAPITPSIALAIRECAYSRKFRTAEQIADHFKTSVRNVRQVVMGQLHGNLPYNKTFKFFDYATHRKLTKEMMQEIKDKWNNKVGHSVTQKSLALFYSVSTTTIARLVR